MNSSAGDSNSSMSNDTDTTTGSEISGNTTENEPPKKRERYARFSRPCKNKSKKKNHRGVISLVTDETWEGAIFISELMAVQYIEQTGMLDFPTVCPKCSSVVARVRALPPGTITFAPENGLSGGAPIITPHYLSHKDMNKALHEDCLKVRCRGIERHKFSIFSGTFYEEV